MTISNTEGIDPFDLLDVIHQELDGLEWSPETLDKIAHHLRTHGYPIGEPGSPTAPRPRPHRTLWAAYWGCSNGQSITLHTTRAEALGEIAESLEIDTTDATDDDLDEDALEARIEDHCLQGADDWHVEEVHLP